MFARLDSTLFRYLAQFSGTSSLTWRILRFVIPAFDNVYAHPLDFSCTVDGNAGKVVSIDFAAHRNHATDPFVSGVKIVHFD
jgi:hypothetical protein